MKKRFLLLIMMACLIAAASAAPAQEDNGELLITEACGDNDFVWSLGFKDYIEIFNNTDGGVDLSNYCIQVKKKIVQLPDETLAPGGYFVLTCDGEDYPSLSKSGFTVSILDDAGDAVDKIVVPESKNQVWLRGEGLGYIATPGYANDAEGEKLYAASVHSGLMISEALGANFIAYPNKRRGVDALEIYNAGSTDVRLSDYYVSDDRDEPDMFRLPGATLRPGEYYTLLCTDEGNGERETGFKISSDGEMIYLSDADGEFVDVLNIPPTPLDISYGRKDGVSGYLAEPSIGKANAAEICSAVAKAPKLSVSSSGGHQEAFTVSISGKGPFYYTTDGREPDRNSRLYENPIVIDQTTTLRVTAAPQGQVKSQTVTAVYRFDTADYELPSVFISVDRSYMTNDDYGLLNNTRDKDLEVPAHVAYIKEDGKVLFSENCGFGIAGQTSRPRANRGWKVTFRDKYGKDNVGVQVFDDLDVTTFDSFVFRLGTTGNPIHDILGTAIGAGVVDDVLYQRYRPVNLFIGGEYYGVYYMREHVNENFVANHLGGDEDLVDIIYNIDEVKEGSNEDWIALMQYCKEHDLAEKEHYDYVAERVDINSFIDYFIWRPYTGDTDHPNIRYVRSRDAADDKWHIVIYDMDWAFQKKEISMVKYTYRLYEEEKHNNIVIYSLLKNEEFRDAFLSRLSYHMKNTFDPDRVNGLLDKLVKEVEHDMAYHQKRWNSSMNAWNQTVRAVRLFIEKDGYDRRTVLLQETKKFFDLSDEQMKEYFGNIKY